MAEHLGKDEKTYSEEYSSFTRDLKSFHDQRGTSFTKLPRLHGREVDLYLLYSLVTARGGWEKININGDWESLLPYFGIHRLCANGPIALKQIYIRYLDVYERIHFLGEEVDRRESELHEEDDARNRRKALRLLHATPTSYNTAQHLIADHVRNTAGLSVDGIQVTATERIFLSLLCPLPNEQDFAINVCSLLAMESRKPFPLHHCPRIVDALLAHAGIFSQVDIRDLFSESYRRMRGQNLSRFWHDVVPDTDIVQLSDEDLAAKNQEEDATVFSYWSQPTIKEKLNGIHRASIPLPTDLDIDAASVSSDGDELQQPLDSCRPVDTSLMEQEVADHVSIMIEDDDGDSHSSEVLYENGAEPMSASVESSDALMVASQPDEERALDDAPNFKNCLAKTVKNLGVVSNQGTTTLNHSPDQTTLHSKSNGELPLFASDIANEQESTEEVDATTKEITACDATSLEESAAGELPSTRITDSALIGTEAQQQVEVNVERKIPLPRNKLPVAVLKPDNPRAIRYWSDQRRIANGNALLKNVENEEQIENELTDSDDWDLFHLGRDQGVHDVLGQRVLQVLNVIRNLSFDELNSSVLAQSEACMRLLLLAAHAKWSCLPQLAFDALSNLAIEINLKDPADCSLSAILLGTVTRGLESSDRFVVLRCMETLCRLAQRSENEILLMSSLDAHVYERLCSYLTIPDVALLIYTLECVYALSSLGQGTCNAFLNCQGAMDVLVSLLTIEAQSYGSRARILMSVVETVAEGSESTPSQLNSVHTTMRPMHPNSPAPSAPSTPPPPMLLQPVATTVPTTSMCHTKILPKPTVNSRPSTPTQSKPNVAIISHTEKEQIAMQWLRATFEPVVGASSIEQNVLYRQYTAACSRSGPKQVLGLVQFFSCVRATFGQNVGPFRKQVGTGVEYYFEGMCPKSNVSAVIVSASAVTDTCPSPTPNSNTVEVPGSPILKAQLCAPPKATTKKDNAPKQSLAHPHLSQALCQGGSVAQPEPQVMGLGHGTPAVSAGVIGGSGPPPSSSLIKSLLANKVPDNNCPLVNHVANLGLSPTATALPGMTRVSCMNAHVSSIPLTTSNITTTTVVPSLSAAPHQQVAQRQQQQRLLQQQHQPAVNNTSNNIHPAFRTTPQVTASLPKVNGVLPSEMASNQTSTEGSLGDKLGGKGMLADLLEREVKKEPVNGAAPLVEKELRISDNGLELVPKDKDSRNTFAVDMGVVGMNNLGVNLGDGAAAPKAAHLIAQVDDSGHVQIHLEEEADSGMSLCNGQSLLDQLEACEVSSSTDSVVVNKAFKRPAEQIDEKDSPALKKAVTNHIAVKTKENPGDSASTVEGLPSTEPINKEKSVQNGNLVNGSVDPNITVSNAVSTNTVVQSIPAFPSQQLQVQQIQQSPVLVGSNAPHTFYILQPQSQQQAKLGFPAQGQRLLLAIQRPGGVVQHVAMPANVVAISSNQLQTNGGIVTLTTSGNITSVINAHRDSKATNSESITASSSPAAILSTTAITTVAASSVVTTPTTSMEGVVTFSGGAVAFPARPTENSVRTSNSSAPESHVTITPVSAAASTISPSAPAVSNASTASKKKTNSGDSSKPRGRPTKNKSTDGQLTSSPSPQPSDPSLPYLCEWKECMKSFKTPHEVYVHACQAHCPAHIDELGCLWDRCDGLKRRRFSMMTHLMDRHCNDEMQKLLAARRHQINTQGKTDIPPPQAPTPHPGYAPHAALHAIKRHAVELMNQKEQEEKEGPVTKSIRLTSALILRNIAMHSSLGRRSLQRYEGHLASVALSNVESSRTVAQILFELTHQCS